MNYPKILQLNSAGEPVDWLNWEDAVHAQATGDVAWSLGDTSFTFRGGMNKDGVQSLVNVSSIIALKGRSKAKRRSTVPALTNPSLFKRDRYVCAYCGVKFPEDKLSREHVIPTSRGGKNVWTNVVTACRKDNHAKGNRTLEEAGMKLLYVPYVPNMAEHLILKQRNILADQMAFLLALVPDNSPLKKEFMT